jgi:hypothetical protein
MKNYRTPRTLAESSFATGYPIAKRRSESVVLQVLFVVMLFGGVGMLSFLYLSR